MLDTYTIHMDNRTKSTITMHPQLARIMGIKTDEEYLVRFGASTVSVELSQSRRLETNEILLSSNCIQHLRLPLSCHYDLALKDQEILIGPFMGILIADTDIALKKKFKRIKRYVENYDLFCGAVLAFSAEGIDIQSQIISGFLYNPQTNQWDRGVFPYPLSIFKRIYVPTYLMRHLKSHLGNQIFNSHYFSKWKVHQFLEKNRKLNKHIPYTTLYKSPDQVIDFLTDQQTAFLKPINGMKGMSIKEIESYKGDYILRYRKNGKNFERLLSSRELTSYLNRNVGSGKYLIQQKLNLMFEEERVVDFRLFVLKDQTGQWNCLGWVGRIGQENSIVSNRSSGGKVVEGDWLLNHILRKNKRKTSQFKEKVFEIGCRAASQMDQPNTNFGYFAIDIGIDQQQNIWIIEMNHRNPNDGLPLYVGDYSLYQQIKTSNMLYSKFLAGFQADIDGI